MIKAVAAVVLVFVALTGCVPAERNAPAPGESPSAPTPSVPSSAPPASSPSADPDPWIPKGSPADPATFAHPDGGIAFASPSGNIQCGYGEYGAGWWWCLLHDQTVELPPDPQGSCTGTDVNGTPIAPNGLGVVAADPDARPQSFCAGAWDGPALAYGMSVTYRDMACESTEEGMTCRSLVSGHGFRLSRSDYQLY
jgi:hypothetical protein